MSNAFHGRRCLYCSAHLKLKPAETPYHFTHRQYCNRDCAQKQLRKGALCEACRKPLVRKPNEAKSEWARRRFCDRICASEVRKSRDNRDFVHVGLMPGVPPNAFRDFDRRDYEREVLRYTAMRIAA